MLRYIERFFGQLKSIFGGNIFELIARNASLVFGIQIASFFLRYLVHVGLARWLGASEYGTYAFVLSMAAILSIGAKLGFPRAVLRFVSEYHEAEEWGYLYGVIQRSWLITLGASLLVCTLSFLSIHFIYCFGYIARPTPLQAGLLLIPLLGLVSLQKEIIRAFEYMALAYAPSYILRRAFVLLFVGVAYAYWGNVDSTDAILLTVAALLIVVVSQALAGWNLLPDRIWKSIPSYRTAKWLRVAWPLLLVSSFNVILNQTDIFLLGVFRTSEEVGFYNVALKTGTVVTFLLTGINAIAGPRIARMYRNREMDRLQRLVSMVAHLSFWPSLLGSILLIAISDPFLRLFGAEFTAGQTAMVILIIGKLVNAGAGSVGYLVNMTGYQDESARVFALSAAANVLFNLIMIPLFGIEGASIATAVTAGLWNIWLCKIVRREIGIKSHIISLPKI